MERNKTFTALVATAAFAVACGDEARTAVATTVGAALEDSAGPCTPFAGIWRLVALDETLRVYGGTAQLSLKDGTILDLEVEATIGNFRPTGAAVHHPTRYVLTIAGESTPLMWLDGAANVVWSKFPVARIVDNAKITGPGRTRGTLHANGTLQVDEGFLLESLLFGTLCLDGR